MCELCTSKANSFAFARVAKAPTADNAILHFGVGSGPPAAVNFHLYLMGSPTGVVGFGNGYGFGVIQGTKSVADGTWHHVAVEPFPSAAIDLQRLEQAACLPEPMYAGTISSSGGINPWGLRPD